MSWTTANFLDVVKDVSGGNVKTPQSEFIKTGKIPVIDQGKDFIAGFTNNQDAQFKSSDLPVVIFGDHTKSIKYVDFPFAMGADGVKVLSVKDGLDSKFFYHYLLQVKIPDAGYSRHYKFLKELKIPLPPLEEQRRIAAILDKAKALRTKRREAIAKLDQLLQSVFLEMFGDPASNPKNLPETSIIKEAEISSGSTPSRSNEENFSGKFPWVKSTEVDWGFIKSTSEHVSDSGIKSARLKTFPPNTVVVALYGQGVTRGKCAILNIAATMNQACAGIKPCATLKHEFLFQFLKMSYQRLRDQARGGNQENLNVGILGEFKIFKPDLKLQEDFSKIFHRVEFLKDKELKSLEELEKLIVSFQVNFFKSS